MPLLAWEMLPVTLGAGKPKERLQGLFWLSRLVVATKLALARPLIVATKLPLATPLVVATKLALATPLDVVMMQAQATQLVALTKLA